MLLFSISFSAMFLSDGTVISISLQVEFTEYLTMMSGLFTVIVLSVLTDGDVVVVIVHHSLWLVFVLFVCNLDIIIFTDAPMEICCSIIVPGDVLCFGYYLTSRYNMVHCLFMLRTHSPFALHLLATYYFLVVSGVYCLVLSCDK